MAKEARRRKSRPSKLERRVHSMLAREGIEFLVHPTIETIVGGAWRRLEPDILVPSEQLAIEVNGCFVHGCPTCYGGRGRARFLDVQRKTRALERTGLTVYVIWEHELQRPTRSFS